MQSEGSRTIVYSGNFGSLGLIGWRVREEVLEDEGRGREGGTALDLDLVCKESRLNPPELSSFVMKNCGRAAPLAPFHRGR